MSIGNCMHQMEKSREEASFISQRSSRKPERDGSERSCCKWVSERKWKRREREISELFCLPWKGCFIRSKANNQHFSIEFQLFCRESKKDSYAYKPLAYTYTPPVIVIERENANQESERERKRKKKVVRERESVREFGTVAVA